MSFSVVMSTFRREHVINRAIDSILAQTFLDFEIIVIDNFGSNYKFADPRIRLYEFTKQRGASHAKNFGITLATKELLCFFDDDDNMLPMYMQRFEEAFSDPVVQMARCLMLRRGQAALSLGTPQVVTRTRHARPTWTAHPRQDHIYFTEIMDEHKWTPASPEFRLVNEVLVQVRFDVPGGLRHPESGL
jgi:glycosyltransferase involved in cell wall biosynthesis